MTAAGVSQEAELKNGLSSKRGVRFDDGSNSNDLLIFNYSSPAVTNQFGVKVFWAGGQSYLSFFLAPLYFETGKSANHREFGPFDWSSSAGCH